MHRDLTIQRDAEVARRYLAGEEQSTIARSFRMSPSNVRRILDRDGIALWTSEQRFWFKVDKSAGPEACWPWVAGKLPNGYGSVRVDGAHWLAHRRAWTLTHGPIPDGLNVLHECDNPPCCNDRHHFLGDYKDNSQDCIRKDRHARGGRHGHAKLSRAHVLELRSLIPQLPRGPKGKNLRHGLMKDLMRGYGVDQSTISCAVRGVTWKHL